MNTFSCLIPLRRSLSWASRTWRYFELLRPSPDRTVCWEPVEPVANQSASTLDSPLEYLNSYSAFQTLRIWNNPHPVCFSRRQSRTLFCRHLTKCWSFEKKALDNRLSLARGEVIVGSHGFCSFQHVRQGQVGHGDLCWAEGIRAFHFQMGLDANGSMVNSTKNGPRGEASYFVVASMDCRFGCYQIGMCDYGAFGIQYRFKHYHALTSCEFLLTFGLSRCPTGKTQGGNVAGLRWLDWSQVRPKHFRQTIREIKILTTVGLRFALPTSSRSSKWMSSTCPGMSRLAISLCWNLSKCTTKRRRGKSLNGMLSRCA